MVSKFRQIFQMDGEVLSWFPGHMRKGIKRVNQMLHKIDCIIEVHDARVPFTGRNTRFQKQLIEMRPHYLILNKIDLCDSKIKDAVEQKIRDEEEIEHIMWTNLRTNQQINRLMPNIMKMIQQSDRFQRANKAEINILVSGIPNVGKSTLINQIIHIYGGGRSSVARQGAKPGVTRAVQEKVKISNAPLVYLYDTPGILEPRFKDPIIDQLKLGACDLLSIDRIGTHHIADYLLFWLNKNEHFSYVEQLKLKEPIDNVEEFLVTVCLKNNFLISKTDPITKQFKSRPNTELAALTFIKLFQRGKLGQFMLDDDKFM